MMIMATIAMATAPHTICRSLTFPISGFGMGFAVGLGGGVAGE